MSDFSDKLLSRIRKQKNKVNLTIEDKSIMIGGLHGAGKTAVMHEIMNRLSEETNNDEITICAPLENGYSSYHGFRKFIPELKDWYNEDGSLREEELDAEPDYIKNYVHQKLFVEYMVRAKIEDVNFPTKVIVFDPLSTAESQLHYDMLYRKYENEGIWVSKEKYGNYGLIYTSGIDIFIREIIMPLHAVGYKTWFVFHLKDKKYDDPVLGERVTFASENSSSFFSEIHKFVDYSVLFENVLFVDKKQTKNKNRTIRWRDGNNHIGAKARGIAFPDSEDIQGKTDREIADLIVDRILKDLQSKTGMTDEQFKKEIENQRKLCYEKDKTVLDNIRNSEYKSDIIKEEKSKRKSLLETIERILTMNLEKEIMKQWENMFDGFLVKTNTKNYEDMCENGDNVSLNELIKNTNTYMENVPGYVKLKEL